ncbi:MAG: hypothetical protein KF892_03785 [Rhizobacter sp.]|nr:hypothetical protein [Rhizobacter sp.]
MATKKSFVDRPEVKEFESAVKGLEFITTLHVAQSNFNHALGRFTLMWADAEAYLKQVLIAYAGVTEDVGRALFSGTRASTAIDQISAIAHNTEMAADRWKSLEATLSHMRAINSMRDKITHHGSALTLNFTDGLSRIITDKERSSRKGKGFTLEVGHQMLDDMTHDTHRICAHLSHHAQHPTGPFTKPQEGTGQRGPWRFKPPQPIATQTKPNPR